MRREGRGIAGEDPDWGGQVPHPGGWSEPRVGAQSEGTGRSQRMGSKEGSQGSIHLTARKQFRFNDEQGAREESGGGFSSTCGWLPPKSPKLEKQLNLGQLLKSLTARRKRALGLQETDCVSASVRLGEAPPSEGFPSRGLEVCSRHLSVPSPSLSRPTRLLGGPTFTAFN